jgi:hypothetical protein
VALSNEDVLRIAEIGVKVIDVQLSLADKTAWEAFHQIWATGYCFGAFEAVARHYHADDVETATITTVGYRELLPEGDGRDRYERAYKLRDNQFFVEGRAHGSDDFSRFLSERGFRPLMLTNFFAFGKPAPL